MFRRLQAKASPLREFWLELSHLVNKLKRQPTLKKKCPSCLFLSQGNKIAPTLLLACPLFFPTHSPGSAEVTNEFAFRPYLVEPETIGGVKFFFQPSRREAKRGRASRRFSLPQSGSKNMCMCWVFVRAAPEFGRSVGSQDSGNARPNFCRES